jgi:hypothetical protein
LGTAPEPESLTLWQHPQSATMLLALTTVSAAGVRWTLQDSIAGDISRSRCCAT